MLPYRLPCVSIALVPNARLSPGSLSAYIAAALLVGTPLHAVSHTALIVPAPNAISVGNCDDAGPGSLRDAIALAGSGDVIDLTRLTCSTISLSTGELSIPQSSLTLLGPGSAALAVDGGGTQRVIDHGGVGTLQVQGMTIRNGYVHAAAADGGCIHTEGSTLVLSDTVVTSCKIVATPCTPSRGGAVFAPSDAIIIDSTISDSDAEVTACPMNYAALGGGLYVFSNLNLIGSTISGNKVTGSSNNSGGGVWLRYGGTFQDSHISANYAPAGGGVFSAGATHFVRSTLDSNIAYANGGGVFAFAATTFDASVLTGNSIMDASGHGGGAFVTGGTLLARDTHFTGNSAFLGAALYSQNDATLERSTVAYNTRGTSIYAGGSSGSGTTTISNSTIAGNNKGGAMFASAAVVFRGPGVIANSTIAFNAFDSAGVVAVGPTLDLRSTIMAANTGMFGPNDLIVAGGAISGDHDLIVASTSPTPPGTLTSCPKLDRLGMNGGITPTIALLQGSVGIDAGSNALMLATDQRGAGFAREFGGGADIGAFERHGEVDDALFSSAFEAYCDSHKR